MALAERGLERAVVDAVGRRPVVVVEGGRAVGKTSLCERLVDMGVFGTQVTLLNQGTRREAEHDPYRWLLDLGPGTIVDEAQLVPEVSVAVKRLVDERRGEPGQFLLTGSARIGRGALGGTDPLAGRATRLTLRPMTASELTGRPLNLASRLLDGDLAEDDAPPVSHRELLRRIERGGLPGYALPGRRWTRTDLTSHVQSVLFQDLDPLDFDRDVATRLFRRIARETSSMQNVRQLSSDLGIAQQTAKAHLDRLDLSFLIHRLPGLRGGASGESKAHPKVHLVDTSFAFWADHRSGGDPTTRSDTVGRVMETFVVNELLAQVSWLDGDSSCSYWRDPRGTAEVDLVLRRDDGGLVGVEIKASREIRGDDLRGLRLLRERHGATRGFVVYTGTRMYEIEDGIWAVPLSTFWESIMTVGAIAPPRDTSGNGAPGAVLFLSYVRTDDEYWQGAITSFARDLADAYEFLTGESLEVFSDQNLAWGELWRQRLSRELRQTTLLLAVVTPRFLRSEACRAEVTEFVGKAEEFGVTDFVLPLIWQPVPALDDGAASTDPVIRALAMSQWAKWERFRALDRTSAGYRQQVAELAEQLVGRVRRAGAAATPADHPSESADEGDLLEKMAAAEVAMAELQDETGAMEREMIGLADSLGSAGPVPGGTSLRLFRSWLGKIEIATAEPATTVRRRLDRMRQQLLAVDDAVTMSLSLLRRHPDAFGSSSADFLAQLRDSPGRLEIDAAGIRDQADELAPLAAMAKEIRRPVTAFIDAAQLMTDLATMTRRWASSAAEIQDRRR